MARSNRADVRKLISDNFFAIFPYEDAEQTIEVNHDRAVAFTSLRGASGFWSKWVSGRTCVALAEGDREKYLFTTSCLHFMDLDSDTDKPIRIPYGEIDMEYTRVDSGMLIVFLKNIDKCVAVMNECDAQRLHKLFILLAEMNPDPVDEIICSDALHCLPALAKLNAGKALLYFSGAYGLDGVEALRVFMHYYKPTADVMSDLFASLSPDSFYLEDDFSQIRSDLYEYAYPSDMEVFRNLLSQLVEIMTFSYGATDDIRQQEYRLLHKTGAALEMDANWLKDEKNMEAVVREGERAYYRLKCNTAWTDSDVNDINKYFKVASGLLGVLYGSGNIVADYAKGSSIYQKFADPIGDKVVKDSQQKQIEKRLQAEKQGGKQYLTVGRAMEVHLSDSRLESGLENLLAAVKRIDDDCGVNITQNISEALKKRLPAKAESQQFDYSGGKLTFDKDNFRYEGVNIWYTAVILENTVSVNDVFALDDYSAYRGERIEIVAIGDGEDKREQVSAGETVSVCIRANVPVEDITNGIFVQVAAEKQNQA